MASVLALLLLCSTFIVSQAAAYDGSPGPAPTHHHHHHHHHHYPPSQSPVPHHHHYPPVQSPVPYHHHYPHSPAPSPVYTPHPPAHSAPVPSPVQPTIIPRSFIQVQGVVYCKSCKYHGVDTLLGAKPLYNATVKLSCKNTKYAPAVVTATTDKNGYFRLSAPKSVTSYAFHRCKIYVVKSTNGSCRVPSKLNGGKDGAELKPARAFMDGQKKPVVLYSVGPLAFEPTCPR